MWWYWRTSAQRRLLERFALQYLEEPVVEVEHPLLVPSLLDRPWHFESTRERIERQVGIWMTAVLEEPPRALECLEPALGILAGLLNVLYLAHPGADRSSGNRCADSLLRWTERLPYASGSGPILAYHALFARFEAFWPRMAGSVRARRGLERLVARSPLTEILWLEHLTGSPSHGWVRLMEAPELHRFVILSLVEKGRSLPDRDLLRFREVLRALRSMDAPPGFWQSYGEMQSTFSGLRAALLGRLDTGI